MVLILFSNKYLSELESASMASNKYLNEQECASIWFELFFPNQLGDFYDKDRNMLQSKNMLELREIEIFLHENTPLDDVYNYIVFGEPTLSNYVKTSLRFRRHLLEDCKEAFNFKPES